jgi:SsrA-binding protein
MNDEKKPTIQDICSNRKAFHDYEIIDTYEVGICLRGTEIKSLRNHGGSLSEAYVTPMRDELWIINSSIQPYSFGSYNNHEENRKRKLLAHKKEIKRIIAAISEKGLTCIPLSIYLKDGFAKVKIALARGKKLYDKREQIKARDDQRNIQRVMKQHL